jgi:hypothetical protein
MSLLRRPGLSLFTTVTAVGAVRGTFTTSSGRFLSVVGTELSEISSTGVVTSRGTLSSAFGVVKFADNGVIAVLVDGPNGYVFNLTSNTLTQIVDVNFHGANSVIFKDGYFIFDWPATQNYYFSPIYWDGVIPFDGLDYEVAESSPDQVLCVGKNGNEHWVFGAATYEVIGNTGNQLTPFQPIQTYEVGIAAKHSLAQINNSLFWLGSSKEGQAVIYKSNGYLPQRISTHAIEEDILSYSSLDDAIGFTFQLGGHYFYVITFQSGDRTWVYDLTTALWHEWTYRDPISGIEGRCRAISYTFFNGKNYVGDISNGRIFELTTASYSDDGDPIVITRRTPHVHKDRRRIIVSEVEFDMKVGVGLVSGQGSDPKMQFRASRDGGNTWGSYRELSIGKMGEYTKKVVARQVGMAYDWVFEIRVSDPVDFVMNGSYAEIEVLP